MRKYSNKYLCRQFGLHDNKITQWKHIKKKNNDLKYDKVFSFNKEDPIRSMTLYCEWVDGIITKCTEIYYEFENQSALGRFLIKSGLYKNMTAGSVGFNFGKIIFANHDNNFFYNVDMLLRFEKLIEIYDKETNISQYVIKPAHGRRKRKVNKLDKTTGKILKTYGSVAEAAHFAGVTSTNISQVCLLNRYSSAGYRWEYAK